MTIILNEIKVKEISTCPNAKDWNFKPRLNQPPLQGPVKVNYSLFYHILIDIKNETLSWVRATNTLEDKT